MPSYVIKDIPEATMKDFKTACAYLKTTMRQDLLNSMNVTIAEHRADLVLSDSYHKTIKKKE